MTNSRAHSNRKAATAAAAAMLSLALYATPIHAFAPSGSSAISIQQPISTATATTRQSSPPLYMNVPTPTIEGGATPEEVKAAADNLPPPSSFFELQRASVSAAKMAMADGYNLLEVEFPPLPANVLEMDDVSAYDVSRANVKLAIDFARSFSSMGVAVVLPDEGELNIMLDDLEMGDKPYPGVTLTSLRKGEEGDTRMFKPENLLIGLMGRGSGGTVKPLENTNMYVVIVASAQELPDVEELYEQIKDTKDADGNAPVIVFYNLKLDILRGDLGAPAFPSKDFQDRFLSRVKPVYYLRTRQYSRSISAPPFIVNYQGCIFRSYPGEFQTLLDTGTGRYRKVVGNNVRPGLGEFKEQLTDALREDGAIASKEDEGSLFGFLRTGYKTTTWWEDERENASLDWKS
mmetsp:Transcript_20515/g.44524  ORF Transcript_20515/g.44524 Transcript_20515/m.44524 type:complete len:404 (-) Transcript_20515:72-1283(-)|eukprot:CAMPEP_0172305854 /NCGR_PEP_ID=MMETSP1058-20130122/7064_1 /TAXON_ID=83371 /ORGANISM="Detonula confervacea, Strain CCMP 353" /LENGTH=403 /DNA_ID=CAMNT_0013017577 /DNA_START=95 /DNA_END=1306 /DNA_ORIENTATION=+